MYYFGFAVADSMFPPVCTISRTAVTPEYVRERLERGDVVSCVNPSHKATLGAAKTRFGLDVVVPDKAPQVKLNPCDVLFVMSVRGLPRLDDKRHEYTQAEIDAATFEFAKWHVLK